MAAKKWWKTVGPRFDCPHCGSTLHMELSSIWKPKLDSPAQIKPISYSPLPEKEPSPSIRDDEEV